VPAARGLANLACARSTLRLDGQDGAECHEKNEDDEQSKGRSRVDSGNAARFPWVRSRVGPAWLRTWSKCLIFRLAYGQLLLHADPRSRGFAGLDKSFFNLCVAPSLAGWAMELSFANY
jgi:hypothetical protein